MVRQEFVIGSGNLLPDGCSVQPDDREYIHDPFQIARYCCDSVAAFSAPAPAQHMIDEPGMFAFTYPMGDLGIASSPRPADAMAMMRATPRMKSRVMMMRHAKPRK